MPKNEPAEPVKTSESAPSEIRRPGKLQQIWRWVCSHLAVTIPATIVLILAILATVPQTRYGIAGLFLTQTLPITIADQQTKTPVSDATIKLAGHTATTDSHGRASLRVPVGPATLVISKKYYETITRTITIGFFKPRESLHLSFQANGRVVPVTVTNWISGQPVSNAVIKAANTSAQTDEHGQATIVLPAGRAAVSANITAGGFNDLAANIQVVGQTSTDNDFTLTPSGQIYLLSNLSGKIDVVKTNLDGTGRTTIVAGTGYEDPHNTSLLASRDWNYLVLESIRDTTNQPKLYLINTSDGRLTTIDTPGPNNSISLIGWYNHYFLYDITTYPPTGSASDKLKSFNADTGQLSVIDQTAAGISNSSSGARQYFSNFTLLTNQVVYTVNWETTYGDTSILGTVSNSLRGIQPNGQGRKDYQTFNASQTSYGNVTGYEPNAFYFSTTSNLADSQSYYKFEDNTVSTASSAAAQTAFESTQPTYLVSPNGDQTLWSELRDGQNVPFLGDDDAGGAKQLTTATGSFEAYGWYTDNYVLLSQDSDALYIAPAATGNHAPRKITDYYKAATSLAGYGYGYGAQ